MFSETGAVKLLAQHVCKMSANWHPTTLPALTGLSHTNLITIEQDKQISSPFCRGGYCLMFMSPVRVRWTKRVE
jgi:hypothetical protein